MRKYRENRKRGTEGFPFAYYNQIVGPYMVESHWHPEIELIYGISGETIVHVSEEKYILKQGDILFVNPQELHSYSANTNEANYHAAVFDISLFQYREPHFLKEAFTNPLMRGTLRFPRKMSQGQERYDEISAIVDRIFNVDIKSKTMVFADLTMLFCSLMEYELLEEIPFEATYKRSEDIKICIQYMYEHYSQKVTLLELADLVHMSPNYFCSYFKKQTGTSPFTQLTSIRIKQASKFLLQCDDSVERIAGKCGFDNVSFFIRKFKEIQGCTPFQYRKKSCTNKRKKV